MNYILYYLIFGFLGTIIEFLYSILKCHIKFPICGDTLNKYFNLCIPFLNIYGLGALIMAFIANRYKDLDYVQYSIILGIILTIMECVIGNISFLFNHYKTWNYDSNICNGFISFEIFIYWTILAYIFRWFYYYIEKPKEKKVEMKEEEKIDF